MARILVVDDEPDVRIALIMLLEDDGHSVTQLDDGKNVMEVIEKFGVDVILLDLSMPDVDGFQVLDMLRKDKKAASIPVIVVSARGRPDDKALAKGLGAVDYINKPWDDGEVELRVQMALGGAQRRWAGEANRESSAKPGQPAEADTAANPPAARNTRIASNSASVTARRLAPPAEFGGEVLKLRSRRPRRTPRVRRVIRRGRRRAA